MSVIEVKKLIAYFFTPFGAVRAVDDINLEIKRGTALGLAGESGCGKSTAAYAIMNLMPFPGRIVSGEVLLKGVDIYKMSDEELRKARWKEMAMVFQGSMAALNPLYKVGVQITEPILLHEDTSKEDAMERARNLLELVGIEASRVDSYPWELSGGMRQRAMVAMALACNPSFLIADEPTTALDVIVSAQVMDLIKNLRDELELSMMLITHDISVIAQTCDELAIMYAGQIVEKASVSEMFEMPAHPYTHALIKAFPSIKGEKRKLEGIPGSPPDLIDPPTGCRFHPRCPFAQEICILEAPVVEAVNEDHSISCHFWQEIIEKR